MKKKFIAVLCAISSAMSLTVAVQAMDTDIINDTDFDENMSGYMTNIPGNGGALAVDDGALKHTHSGNNGAHSNSGIKKDITKQLKDANFKTGDTLTVSVDVSSSWYDEPATASLEIEGMDSITLGTIDPGGQQWGVHTLTGSKKIESDIPENYTAYFVVTQQCDAVIFDNIKLTLNQDDGDTPVDPVDPTEKPVVSTKLIGNEIFQNDNFTIYDNAAASGSIGTVWQGSGVEANLDKYGNEKNGVKTDITDYVRGHSGETFTLSVMAQNWNWGDNAENKATAFFKVVGSDGGERIVNISTGPDSSKDILDGSKVTLTGRAVLTFGDSDTVYLCFTHKTNYQQYHDLTLSVSGEAVSPTEQPTEQPSEEPTNPPVEGDWETVVDTTGMNTADIQNLINNETITEYVKDAAVSHGVSVKNEYNDNPCIEAESAWDGLNGMKIDISKYIQNGSTVKAKFQLMSKSTKPIEISLFKNEEQSGTKFTANPLSNWSWGSFETDEFTVAADNNDKVYLVFANPEVFRVADLVIYVKSGAEEPVKPEFGYEQAKFEGQLAGATLSDDKKRLTSGDEVVTAYKCSYTGPATHGLDVIVTSGDADAKATITTTIADNSPVVFYVLTNRDNVKITAEAKTAAVPVE